MNQSFECDQEYENGTVVCPGTDSKLTQCTHDNCPYALVIDFDPTPNDGFIYNMALAGSVDVKTSSQVSPKQLLVSDGAGGVRPVNYGEPAFTLGFAMNDATDGHVRLFIRPIFVILRPAK